MGRGIKHRLGRWAAYWALLALLGGCGNGQPYSPLTDASSDFNSDDFGGVDAPDVELNQVFLLRMPGVFCDAEQPGVRATISLDSAGATWRDLCLNQEVQLQQSDYAGSFGNLGIVYGGFLYLNQTLQNPRVACAFTGFNLIVIDQDEAGLTFRGGFETSQPAHSPVSLQLFPGVAVYQYSESGFHFDLQVPMSAPNQSSLSLSHTDLNYTGPATCIAY